MDNTHQAVQAGGNLSIAVDRLDRALQALESRVRGLQNGETYEPDTSYTAPDANYTAAGDSEYQRVLAELAEVRLREQQLAQAANGAYEALGVAAANIRAMLSAEAA